MLKGDRRKQQILDTAEKMFSEKGYEQTSVQDILDVLHLSKGSFYHHFESKEILLKKMCESRAVSMAEAAAAAADKVPPEKRVEHWLSSMIPFTGEGIAFIRMILPVFSLPEGRSIRHSFQDALKDSFLPLTADAFHESAKEKYIFCEDAQLLAGICIDLINDLWCSVSDLMLKKENEESFSINEALHLISGYRSALENLLTAAYGSLKIMNLDDLKNYYDRLTGV